MLKQKLNEVIVKALKGLGFEGEAVGLERPTEEAHGDYATSVALGLAKKFKKPPLKVAEDIVAMLPKIDGVAKVEVASPGFINFFLADDALVQAAGAALEQVDRFGWLTPPAQALKLIIEFTDPNPFKEFHIGHLYSNAVGESLARLHEAAGFSVRRANYQGDVGLHVAKAIWGLLEKSEIRNPKSETFETLKDKSLGERVKFLGEAYSAGAQAYEQDPSAKKNIEALNAVCYACSQRFRKETAGAEPVVDYAPLVKNAPYQEDEIYPLWVTGRQWSLEYFEQLYQRLGTKFDFYFFESETGEAGFRLVQEWLKQGVFEKGEGGAIVFKGDAEAGLHTRVFINSQGLPTYEAKDLALAGIKFHQYPYDQSIIVTGNEVNDYFKVVLAALSKVTPALAEKTRHLGHGMVRLPEGKMASRTGNVLTGEWLLEEAKQRIVALMATSAPDMPAAERAVVAEAVAVGAVKYSLLKSNIGSNVSFSFEESISFEGNSGPYLQYAYARARSILTSAGQTDFANVPISVTVNPEERAVLLAVARFPEIVASAAEHLAPHTLCLHLHELAQRFNSFYVKHSVLKAATPDERALRLLLTAACATTLKNGLWLLGITAPERM